MSHASGAVKFPDGKIMHFEYNGTSDICISHLYETHEEMWAHWRKGTWLECSCGNDEPVEIGNNYGGGMYWNGRACRYCLAITDSLEPPDGWSDGFPEWWPLDES